MQLMKVQEQERIKVEMHDKEQAVSADSPINLQFETSDNSKMVHVTSGVEGQHEFMNMTQIQGKSQTAPSGENPGNQKGEEQREPTANILAVNSSNNNDSCVSKHSEVGDHE